MPHDHVSIPHDLRAAIDSYERTHIENVLRDVAGDRMRAAKLLGVSRSSLYRKLEKLGILD
jgi:transcriptional regulator with PAS, ATPase and Fis domain